MWSSLLSSCKDHEEVELGRIAANQLFKMESCNAAPYVTLAHIYAKAGLCAEVAEVQKEIRKSARWSWVEDLKWITKCMFSQLAMQPPSIPIDLCRVGKAEFGNETTGWVVGICLNRYTSLKTLMMTNCDGYSHTVSIAGYQYLLVKMGRARKLDC
ncbi:Pentatricopeptide repeat-containing protein [Fagus crenata]